MEVTQQAAHPLVKAPVNRFCDALSRFVRSQKHLSKIFLLFIFVGRSCFGRQSPRSARPRVWNFSLTVRPGLVRAGQYYQIGTEVIPPINALSGRGIGGVVQLHFYLDDLRIAQTMNLTAPSAMLGIAAVNKFWLTPDLAARCATAPPCCRRSGG